MKFHVVLSKIPYYFIKQCFTESKLIFPHKPQKHTSGIVLPPISGRERLMSGSSLKLELWYLWEEYQQAPNPG